MQFIVIRIPIPGETIPVQQLLRRVRSSSFLQWWTSTQVTSTSTQCASSPCASSAWASSCCCCQRTGTSASSSSAPSFASATSRRRAAARRAPPRASTGEGEDGPPCQHLHTDSERRRPNTDPSAHSLCSDRPRGGRGRRHRRCISISGVHSD